LTFRSDCTQVFRMSICSEKTSVQKKEKEL